VIAAGCLGWGLSRSSVGFERCPQVERRTSLPHHDVALLTAVTGSVGRDQAPIMFT